LYVLSGAAGATSEESDDGGVLAVEVRSDGPHAVLVLRGELDMAGVALVTARVAATRAHPDVTAVDLDLSAVTFLDSAGLNCLLKAQAEAAAAGIPLQVVAASPGVRRVVDLAGVADLVADAG
jgi:anti-anti-sigma factor